MTFLILKIKKTYCVLLSMLLALRDKVLVRFTNIIFKNLFLVILMLNFVCYSTKSYSFEKKIEGVADTLVSAFKCNTVNKKTNNMLQGLNQALAAVKSENCKQVRQALNNIPRIQYITQAMQDNQVVHQIKIQESRIKTFMAEMQRTKDEEKKQMFQNMVDRARVQLLELESQLAVEKSRLKAHNISNSVDELHTFADKMIETINQNRECFEDNQELTQHAMASLTGIAGLLFSTSSVGMGLMAVSKITQKLFSIGKEEGEKSATESVKLGIGLRCALQNINSIHCENLKNANLLDKLTEAGSTCVDCAGKSTVF